MVNVKKWHQLFDMHVQEMLEKDVFSRNDLSWSEVYCPGGNKNDLVVAIPITRLDDFKKGKQNNLEGQCTFVRKHFVNKTYNETEYLPKTSAIRTCSK